ncbi:MAG: hypothetical protein LBB23_01175 [Rickettsiales bacterium]|jgi:ATP-dependent exoDNAse (exonuclease V) beta subunit|nr:hypothetical protein [Rickettsiales bacterium]
MIKEFLAKMAERDAAKQAGVEFHKLAEKGELDPGIFAKTPGLSEFFGANARAEVPVAGKINGKFLSRRIDRLVVSESEVKFVDFKTGSADEDHSAQMGEYKKILADIYPGKNVSGFIYWLKTGELQKC